MAQSRFYSSNAQPTSLASGVTPSDVSCQIQASVGFPASVPFVAALDYGTSAEELVLVTAQAGTNWTITRGFDSTSASSHAAGAPVRHVWCGADGNDSRAHEGSSSAVHGVTGAVVGTTDTQNLSNKTLVSPTTTGIDTINGNIFLTNQVTGNAAITAKGAVGQTGNLLSLQDSSSSNRFTVASSGATVISNNNTAARGLNVDNPSGLTANAFGVRVNAVDQFTVNAAGNGTFAGNIAAANITTGAWTSAPPTWTCTSGGNPVIGNGTITGVTSVVGKTCTFSFNITAGTTTTFGGGEYQFSLPFTAASGTTYEGSAQLQATGGSTIRVNGVVLVPSGGTTCFIFAPTTATNVGTGSTGVGSSGLSGSTWAATTNNIIRGTVTYQTV